MEKDKEINPIIPFAQSAHKLTKVFKRMSAEILFKKIVPHLSLWRIWDMKVYGGKTSRSTARANLVPIEL
jgi:hypothetical protein